MAFSFELDAVIVAAVVLIVVVVVLYLYFFVWALKKRPVTGIEAMRGKSGVAVNGFVNGVGEVTVDGVIWKAKVQDGSKILKDDSVLVADVSALELIVKKK